MGIVTGARGISGEIRIRSFTSDPTAVAAYGPVSDERGARSFRLRVKGLVKGQVVAVVEGIDDRNAAETLKGEALYVPRGALPEAEENEFYHADLIGLRAERGDAATRTEAHLGTVCAVHDFGAGSVIEIAGGPAGVVMVPFTTAAVPLVDVAGGRIVVAALDGLLEEKPGERAGRSEDGE